MALVLRRSDLRGFLNGPGGNKAFEHERVFFLAGFHAGKKLFGMSPGFIHAGTCADKAVRQELQLFSRRYIE